jgi:hypothetical protein
MVLTGVPHATFSNEKASELYGGHAVALGWGILENDSFPLRVHTAPVRIITLNQCGERISAILQNSISIDKILLCTIGYPYVHLKGVSMYFCCNIYPSFKCS